LDKEEAAAAAAGLRSGNSNLAIDPKEEYASSARDNLQGFKKLKKGRSFGGVRWLLPLQEEQDGGK
jgi:hypothetical protein